MRKIPGLDGDDLREAARPVVAQLRIDGQAGPAGPHVVLHRRLPAAAQPGPQAGDRGAQVDMAPPLLERARPEESQDGVDAGLGAAAQADAEQRSAAVRGRRLNAIFPGPDVVVEIVRHGLHEQRGEQAARARTECAHRKVRVGVDARPEIGPRGCLTGVPFFVFQFEQCGQVPMGQQPGLGLRLDDGMCGGGGWGWGWGWGWEKEVAIHAWRFARGIEADADSRGFNGPPFRQTRMSVP
uniref:Uncharacterized protein n=1 Tax=Ralstonia solanacearum CFBP2957 TaxID=859656 RepID=D8P4S8_RALSL|nr:protein of unknown function [Ralstonia solanacearum CFBP2957]